jgi:hypothetical protein
MSEQEIFLGDEDVQRITQAMGAIQLIRGHYASSVEGQRLLQEILKLLRAAGSSLICRNVADAIDCANRVKRVTEAPFSEESSAA